MEQFLNDTIDIDLLPKYEEAPLNALHPDYWKIILLNITICIFCIGSAAAVIIWLNDELKQSAYYIGIGIFVFAIFLFIIYRISFKRRGIAVRERDIIYSSGILSSKTTVIPFTRIQHVTLQQGIFSRIFKLGALEVYTAGGATGNIKIHGLGINDARRIKELLSRKLTYATS